MSPARPLLLLPVFFALACRSAPTQPNAESIQSLVTGSWGGERVGLVLGPSGGSVEYDCARGAIEGPLRVDGRGYFYAAGYHVVGVGGPERVGHVPTRSPASYSGRVEGDTMILVVRAASLGVEIGPLSLRRNEPPTIVRCL